LRIGEDKALLKPLDLLFSLAVVLFKCLSKLFVVGGSFHLRQRLQDLALRLVDILEFRVGFSVMRIRRDFQKKSTAEACAHATVMSYAAFFAPG